MDLHEAVVMGGEPLMRYAKEWAGKVPFRSKWFIPDDIFHRLNVAYTETYPSYLPVPAWEPYKINIKGVEVYPRSVLVPYRDARDGKGN